MPRFLGIDYGTRRIGLAVGDSDVEIASPLQTIDARGPVSSHVEAVIAVASKYDVDAFVVGLPFNMDGTETDQAKITRRFGDELCRASGKPVRYWDERLSSVAARELLKPGGLSRKKHRAVEDCVAAQVILQSFFDAEAGD
jgi:putative Holliday junction resolvase